jgi:hypothetical protein
MTPANEAPGRAVVTMEGIVEAVNDHGVLVVDAWRNVLKFKPVELPAEGTRVRLEVDARGYTKSLDVLSAGPASSATCNANRSRRATHYQTDRAHGGPHRL